MENEEASTVCSLDPGSPLFLSGDGFEPTSVLFPHATFHFPSKGKKEAYDFMDKVEIHSSFLYYASSSSSLYACQFLYLGC